jgi:hemicentin
MINQTLELKCQADGVPEPQIIWQFDGSALTTDGNISSPLENTEIEFISSDRSVRIRITNLTSEHQGRFTCVATNKAGKAEADIFVQVMGETS